MKINFLIVATLITSSSLSFADILRSKPRASTVATASAVRTELFCTYVTPKTGRTIEIVGVAEGRNQVPQAYQNLMKAGQVIVLEKGASKAQFVLTFDQFVVGRSGFAGRNVQVAASSSAQSLEIKFVTGASAGQTNGQMKVSKNGVISVSGAVTCRLQIPKSEAETEFFN